MYISPRIASLLCVAALAAYTVGVRADSLAVVPPLPLPGPEAVGCSSVEQDFSRLTPGEDVQLYWEGVPRADGSPRYITDLIAGSQVPVIPVAAGSDTELFGPYANQTFPYAVLVCYPTPAGNPRGAYPLPTGKTVPHMQRGADAPLFADPAARYPVLLFSHGYGGSPISNDYVDAVALLASYGYVVVAPFHGDSRFSNLKVDDLSNVGAIVATLRGFVGMQSLRPLSLQLATDYLLAHPSWRDHVDAQRVGGFGASMGGEAMMLLAGARLTTSIGLSSKRVTQDPRLKAIVGYVPYFGQPVLPSFGRDQSGLDGLTVPFLGIGGTSDTTAPLAVTLQGVRRLAGTRTLVALLGVKHEFSVPATADIFTWSLVFLDAHLRDSPSMLAQSARMTSVQGGVEDATLIDYTAPAAAAAGERTLIEYYYPPLKHFFVTGDATEVAILDQNVMFPGWSRTGYDFKAWLPGSAQGTDACRFFGTPGLGPATHFYTILANECSAARADPRWTYEGTAFDTVAPVAADCPAGRIPVTRLYNNGMDGTANHRYLTSRSEILSTVAEGWMVEGVVFCAVP